MPRESGYKIMISYEKHRNHGGRAIAREFVGPWTHHTSRLRRNRHGVSLQICRQWVEML